MKKLLICLTLFFSFLFISIIDIKAAIKTTSGNFTDLPQGDKFIIIKNSKGYRLLCWKESDQTTEVKPYISTSKINGVTQYSIRLNVKVVNGKFYDSTSMTGSWTNAMNITTSISHVYTKVIATNVKIYENEEYKKISYDVGYGLVPDSININFHLNGGILTDFSNILNPIVYENNFNKNILPSDIESYFNSIVPMKNNHSFVGWYYDENFTQPFNITDTITSDINLYAKFSLNPTIYFHLNNGYIEDYSITNEEIKEIKNNMCELANCKQYDSYATNPYNQMLSGITSAKIDYFLSNHYTSNNQEFRNLAMKLVNEDYTKPTYYNEDYSKQLSPNNIKNYITNITPKRMFQTFVGWYYDKALTQPYKIDDIITNDTNLYAKWRHNNVNEFLNNTTFIDYTFDTNFEYAIITRGSNTGDIYLGLGHMINNLELYEYDQNNFLYLNGASLCLTPYYSKDNMYYYLMESELYNNIEVLVIPKSKLENQGSTFYDFKLSNNAYVTYTNDLTKVEIYDDNNNKIETNLSDSYNYSQDALLNDKDVVSIFKDLFKFKDNKVFQHFNQMWNLFRKSDLYNYFIILIIGSLIVLIIKAAKRM